MPETPQVSSGAVDFDHDPQAPEAPDVGIAISLATTAKIATFSRHQPIVLHGSYKADMALIRLCREGLSASILVTLVRTDKPWGRTTRLVTPKTPVTVPPPPDSGDRPQLYYREGGWFTFDLAKFFAIPPEPGKYQVEVILGPYHSQRLDFEVR